MKNRFISFELLFALLLIIVFFLPWLDMGIIKIIGWDIPGLQKQMAKIGNVLKVFSKNKDSIYSAYVVYLIPLFSFIVIGLWLMLKQKAARVLLMIEGIFGFVVSLNLFYSLPRYGSGVYLLCAASILSIVYLIFIFRQKKEPKTEQIQTPPNDAGAGI